MKVLMRLTKVNALDGRKRKRVLQTAENGEEKW